MDDAELILLCRHGDQHAFAELVGRYRNNAWGVCLQITGNHTDAEDALQETLVAAWRNLDKFRGESRFNTWLHRIAANAALAVLRRRKETSSLAPATTKSNSSSKTPPLALMIGSPPSTPFAAPSPNSPKTSGSRSSCASSRP